MLCGGIQLKEALNNRTGHQDLRGGEETKLFKTGSVALCFPWWKKPKPLTCFSKLQNHRMVRVGGDLRDHPVLTVHYILSVILAANWHVNKQWDGYE